MNKLLLTSILTVGVAFASEGRTDEAAVADSDSVVSAEAVAQLRERLAALSENSAQTETETGDIAAAAAAEAAPASNVSKFMTLDMTEDEFEQRLAEGRKKAEEERRDAFERRDSVSNFRGLEEDFGSLPEQPTQPGDATRLLQEMIQELKEQEGILRGLHKNGTIPDEIWEEVYPKNLVSTVPKSDSERLKRDIQWSSHRINQIVTLCAGKGIDLRPYLKVSCKKA